MLPPEPEPPSVPRTPGFTGRRLAPCPASPNCVSSLSPDPAHRVEPLRFRGSAEQAQERLRRVVGGMARTRIVEDEPGYLRVEFRSWVLRFVDDLELAVGSGGVIDVRSASRVGRSDLGVNRRRVERLRAAFMATEPPAEPA